MADESRYILAKKIARGGMAEIYLGKHVGDDGFQRLCAIKRILPHYAQDKEFIEMFRDEAHICKRLQHANIVRVEGFEEVEGSYAIIMEFIDGSDLRSLLSACEKSGTRLSIPSAVFITCEASRGLHYAHTKVDEITQQPLNIVHRDISPQNILVSYEGEIKITDFGIADAGSKITETKPGIVKGKYSYMSPEQISAKQVDARADVFALAIVLWEMLAMKRLFQGENEVDTINLVRACKIPARLRDLNPEVDDELEQIVLKGLARDIKKRYGSAGELEKDLRRYLSKKFPGFTSSELGGFLKTNLATKRDESAADIKKTLTEANLRPALKSGKKRSVGSGDTDSMSLSMDDAAASNLSISVAKKRGSKANENPNQGSLSSKNATISQFRTQPSRHSSAHQPLVFERRKPKTSPTAAYMAALLLALGVIFGAIQYSGIFAAKEPAQILLRTTPAVVRIMLDGKKLFDGAYKRTPVGLKLPPGKHVLSVQRPGYDNETVEFVGEPGKISRMNDVVLQAKIAFSPTKITVINLDAPRVTLDIAQGFAGGVLTKDGPNTLAIKDLAYDKPHQLRISVDGTTRQFVCKFVPKASSWRAPTILTVDMALNRCILRNPQGS